MEAPKVTTVEGQSAATDAVHEPQPIQPFIIDPYKLAVMSICTFGLYELWWMRAQWRAIQAADSKPIRPFWRAFFGTFYIYSLLKRLGVAQAALLGLSWFLIGIMWRLPDPYWLISMFTFVPLAFAQQSINKRAGALGQGGTYSGKAVAVCIVGGIVFLLAVYGTFLSDK